MQADSGSTDFGKLVKTHLMVSFMLSSLLQGTAAAVASVMYLQVGGTRAPQGHWRSPLHQSGMPTACPTCWQVQPEFEQTSSAALAHTSTC